ncbi:peptidase, partial [Priestia aryabhattai]|nr:peptidase [Priestia aryabhattai]
MRKGAGFLPYCYGNGKMLHSPKTGKTVELIELKGTLYEEELCAARRYY